jgi:hypothetical protein
VNTSLAQALTAMQAFAEATYRQYANNLDLFHTPKGPFSEPLTRIATYSGDKLAAAQTYQDAKGTNFALLAHLEGDDVDFLETETLVWLGNDAAVFDMGVKAKGFRQEERMHGLVQMHGERAIARALYLKCLLGSYIRALETGLLKRALERDPSVGEVARTLAHKSADEFTKALELIIPTLAFQQEIVAFARQAQFPLFPIAIGHELKGREVVNGALLTPELANQMRAAFAKQKESRKK